MSNMMKALVKAKAEPGIWMEQVPVPEPGPNDVLIKIRKTAICGTDVHIYNWDEWAQKTIPVPMVVGHEFVGTVAENGATANRYKVGTRVSGEGHIVCGTCRNCRAGRGQLCRNTLGVGVNRPGAFGEYLCIPQSNVVPIPEDVPYEIAAIFDPFGNAVHTALSFNMVGEDVLVTGAGPIGIMGALVAKRAGARKVVITDINQSRLELAAKAGVQYKVNPREETLQQVMDRIGMYEGFDIGLEMSGAVQAFKDMLQAMNNGGKVAILGIPPSEFAINWDQVIFKMLTLKGIYGREMYDSWYKMIAFVQGGLDLSKIITHRMPIDDFQAGFDAMRSGDSGKVVLDWE
ncbi:MAG: L-threonine 3-dehydrogenase [Rhizobiaceae bacterium]